MDDLFEVLNVDLLERLLEEKGVSAYEATKTKNRSGVTKKVWATARAGKPIRRSNRVKIAEYLEVDPSTLLLAKRKATYEMVLEARLGATLVKGEDVTEGRKEGGLPEIDRSQPEKDDATLRSHVFQLPKSLPDFVGREEEIRTIMERRAIVKCCGCQLAQAALVCSTPSTNRTPAITFANSGEPFNSRHFFAADSINLNTIVKHADRLPLPFVLTVRNRTVANVDSIGLVVRR